MQTTSSLREENILTLSFVASLSAFLSKEIIHSMDVERDKVHVDLVGHESMTEMFISAVARSV